MIARRTDISRMAAAAVLAMTLALTAMPAARATTYSIIETTPAVVSTRTAGLNNFGQIVGNGQLWSGGVVVDLRPYFNPILNTASDFGTASDINDAGDIAGETDVGSFVRTCGGGGNSLMSRLDATGLRTCVPFSSNNNFGTRVNASGQIAGTKIVANGPNALFWDPAINLLVTLPSVDPPTANLRQWDALAINSGGEIVGYDRKIFPTIQPRQAVRWTTAGTPTALDLGNLGGAEATATGINDSGRIVGVSKTATLEDHAFLWVSGTINDIGAFSPSGINEADQIVGSQTLAGVTHAVLYEGGTLTDLNTALPLGSGWVLESATQVNELGQISGKGTLNGTPTAFLLLPDTAPLAAANLATSIAPNQNPYVSGNLSYSGTVTNLGPDPGTGVVLSIGYSLNDALGFPSAAGSLPQMSRGSCRVAEDQLFNDTYASFQRNLIYYWCSIGALAVGETVTVSLVTAGPGGSFNFNSRAQTSSRLVATLFGQQLDSSPVDNQLDLTIVNSNNVDLAISISDSPDPVLVGGTVTYVVTVANIGPTPATNVQATGSLGTCSLGAIASGASASCTLTAVASVAGTLSRTMSVAASQPDSNTGNNSATATTTVQRPPADLALTLTDTPDPVTVGGTVTYTATVTNNGPGAATAVTVSGSLATCSLGTIASGASASCTRTAVASAAGTLSQTMSVTAAESDPNPGNNSATATTTVLGGADLAVTITDSPDPVKKGMRLTYTVVVSNGGPQSATGVALSVVLPANITLESKTSSQGTCSGSATVSCALGSLGSGSSATVTIKIKPMKTGTATSTASVTGTSTDPNGANNAATATTTVKR